MKKLLLLIITMVMTGCNSSNNTSETNTERTYSEAEYNAVVRERDDLQTKLDEALTNTVKPIRDTASNNDWPETPISDFTHAYNAEHGGVEITKYTGSNSLKVRIPDTIEDVAVVAIGESAFRDARIMSVYIPSSVTSIRDYSFSHSEISSITIPDSVTEIGGEAFYECIGLTSITIPGGVTEIKGSTFRNCTELTNVNIPNSVTKIDSAAFRGCSSLDEATRQKILSINPNTIFLK